MIINFPKWTHKLPGILALGGFGGLASVVFAFTWWGSPWHLEVGYQPEQPIPYSHKQHPGMLGLDCRYCHQAVHDGPQATIPSSQTCMNCHAQIKTQSAMLEPLRNRHDQGHRDFGKPIPWVKVHMLPDYAYFDHSVHVNAGVGCASCHGRVDQMEIVRQEMPLSMSWCLECHRQPEPHLREADQVTNMEYDEQFDPAKRLEIGTRIREQKRIAPPTHCSGCHR